MGYIATYLIYFAVITRAVGWNQETAPIQTAIWVLLAIFGVFLFTERELTRRFPLYPRVYTLLQSGMVIAMLYLAPTVDFLPMLFFPLSFQAVEFFHKWVGFSVIGIFSLAMIGMVLSGLEWEAAVTMVLANSAANVLMGSFAHLMRRTDQQRQENQRMFADLQKAYRQLKDSSAQAEALAAAEERHNLVRELHDSLTQTLFSINLAAQAAQLSAQSAPGEVPGHLARVQALTRNAAREVQTLTGQEPSHPIILEGLAAAIRRLADERLALDGLQVSLEVTGERELSGEVQAALYRIVQEALNNISRHASTRLAQVRLCLESPHASMEIEDAGIGFNLNNRSDTSGYGLVGMTERAAGIGWVLEIESQPGQGTHIRLKERAT